MGEAPMPREQYPPPISARVARHALSARNIFATTPIRSCNRVKRIWPRRLLSLRALRPDASPRATPRTILFIVRARLTCARADSITLPLMAEPLTVPNPLHDLHRQAEAEFQSWASIEIVSTFGEPQAEYAALHKGCALVDLPQRGVIEVTGKDRLPFLNNLISNEVYSKQMKSGIAAGRGVYAFLLN